MPQEHQGMLRRARQELKDLKEYMEEGFKTLLPGLSPSEIRNKKEIRIVGLRRTGNHAIANWIEKQEQGKIEYINDIPCDKNPYLHLYERHLRNNKSPKIIQK